MDTCVAGMDRKQASPGNTRERVQAGWR
jgi:hypothetical protein